MAEPKIFSKNYVNADDVFVFSHGAGGKSFLYDRDRNTRYQSTGANNDATEMTIDITFYEGSTPINRTITQVCLLAHNFRDWELFYWNGSTWVLAAWQDDTFATNAILDFASVTTSKIRLAVTETHVAHSEKALGELIICGLTLDIGVDLDSYEIRYRQKTREHIMGDGSMHRMIVRGNGDRSGKYEARVGLKYVSQATYDSLLNIKESGEPFLWQPESSQRPDQLFYVHWSNPWAAHYVSAYKGAGYELQMDLKEV